MTMIEKKEREICSVLFLLVLFIIEYFLVFKENRQMKGPTVLVKGAAISLVTFTESLKAKRIAIYFCENIQKIYRQVLYCCHNHRSTMETNTYLAKAAIEHAMQN